MITQIRVSHEINNDGKINFHINTIVNFESDLSEQEKIGYIKYFCYELGQIIGMSVKVGFFGLYFSIGTYKSPKTFDFYRDPEKAAQAVAKYIYKKYEKHVEQHKK